MIAAATSNVTMVTVPYGSGWTYGTKDGGDQTTAVQSQNSPRIRPTTVATRSRLTNPILIFRHK
ncbi:hypothetical protein [Nonomuraea salmonea]|uniref:hypothetical protein n=1 Tax=Nonomuraea salmonea TaxID=46181 RepID=UPI0031EF2B6F